MKNKATTLALGAFISLSALTSCGSAGTTTSTKYYNPYSTSEFISKDTQGLITLRGVSDESDTQQDAVNNSHRKALEKLFYQGFPGTDFKQPMIPQGKSVEAKNQAFFDQFWKSGYKTLITNNTTKFYPCAENKKCATAASTFSINYNNLRKELEQAGVIRKLGF